MIGELLWIAQIITGSSVAAERCLAEAFELAETARYVGREWILPWVRRLLVHVALKTVSGEIRELLPAAQSPSLTELTAVSLSARERYEVRSMPAPKIIGSCDVLERACFILFAYLRYPLLDCALLLGCPRAWIEPICGRVLTTIFDVTRAMTKGPLAV